MHRVRTRVFALLSATALLSCDKEPLAPSDDPSLAASPGDPLSLTATPVSHTVIFLAWQDMSSRENGFEVHRAVGSGGTFTLHVTTGPDAIDFGDGDLTAATQYCYQVRSFRTTGRKVTYSGFSNTACATTHNFPAPSELNARPTENQLNTALLTWKDNSPDEEGFRVERAPSDQGPWESVIVRAANTTSHSDANRALEQQVCYRVIAFKGQAGAASNVDCTSFPASPTDLTVTAASGQAVELAWTDNSVHEDGFDIERADSQWGPVASVGTVAANVSAFRDAAVIADRAYWYRVRVIREGVRTGSTNTINAITASGPPLAPSGLQATPSGSTAISTYWVDNSASETGFRVERSENGGASWIEAGTTIDVGFLDHGRTTERQVCYRVIAFNALGDSPASNMDCTAPPAAPTNLVATTVRGLAIDLTWSDNSSVEDGYVVQRRYDYCGYYYGCSYYYYPIATLGPNATGYRDTALSPGELHVYLVNAVKDGSHSDPSNEVGVYPDLPPPAPASNLTAVPVARTRIDLAWNDNSTDEASFYIYRCTGTEAACVDNNFAPIGSTGPNASTFSDTSVLPNTTYTYWIYTCSSYQCAAPSNKASATTPP
jgi:hypothetical protein